MSNREAKATREQIKECGICMESRPLDRKCTHCDCAVCATCGDRVERCPFCRQQNPYGRRTGRAASGGDVRQSSMTISRSHFSTTIIENVIENGVVVRQSSHPHSFRGRNGEADIHGVGEHITVETGKRQVHGVGHTILVRRNAQAVVNGSGHDVTVEGNGGVTLRGIGHTVRLKDSARVLDIWGLGHTVIDRDGRVEHH